MTNEQLTQRYAVVSAYMNDQTDEGWATFVDRLRCLPSDYRAETLAIAAGNERREHDAIVFAVKHLWGAVNRTAKRVAKENAEWHDDPAAEDHAAFHAPADVQFPKDVREQAARDLFDSYFGELLLSGK